jgi:hypothetical protein
LGIKLFAAICYGEEGEKLDDVRYNFKKAKVEKVTMAGMTTPKYLSDEALEIVV